MHDDPIPQLNDETIERSNEETTKRYSDEDLVLLSDHSRTEVISHCDHSETTVHSLCSHSGTTVSGEKVGPHASGLVPDADVDIDHENNNSHAVPSGVFGVGDGNENSNIGVQLHTTLQRRSSVVQLNNMTAVAALQPSRSSAAPLRPTSALAQEYFALTTDSARREFKADNRIHVDMPELFQYLSDTTDGDVESTRVTVPDEDFDDIFDK